MESQEELRIAAVLFRETNMVVDVINASTSWDTTWEYPVLTDSCAMSGVVIVVMLSDRWFGFGGEAAAEVVP